MRPTICRTLHRTTTRRSPRPTSSCIRQLRRWRVRRPKNKPTMPLYEYHCLKCGKNFDALQKFADPPVKKHEGCGGKTERVLSAPSFQLKGSGWYITDYGKGGNKPGEKAAAEKSEKSENKAC